MNYVNTTAFMVGMFAIGGLIAGGSMFNAGQQAFATAIGGPLITVNPVNAAAASNSDDDVVVQSNVANVKQKADVDCDAKVSDNDKFQIGDNNNIAANECEAENESFVAQGNFNSDDDVQVADATACQALAFLGIGANICDTTITVGGGNTGPGSGGD
jgi:hypothetical protein